MPPFISIVLAIALPVAPSPSAVELQPFDPPPYEASIYAQLPTRASDDISEPFRDGRRDAHDAARNLPTAPREADRVAADVLWADGLPPDQLPDRLKEPFGP